jgi:hypothetical protein
MLILSLRMSSYLQPWTSRPMDRPHTEEEKGKKLEVRLFLSSLRHRSED